MRRKKFNPRAVPAATAGGLDDRLQLAAPLRRLFNKVFPDHWSFLLGEISLYSFIVLLITGVFLTLFFDPSQTDVRYNGSYVALKGIEMSKAYASTLSISFDVRGGLFIRQMHHWAALLFMASIVVHMFRIFFTGAFRKPRELNWIIGLSLFWVGFLEGFAGYSLPDDALSGTGLRIASAIMLSIPLVGTWLTTSLFGGEFPGTEILGRLYIGHVLLIPGLIIILVTAHMFLLIKQKHTQWPGPRREEHNVVGVRMFPGFAAKSGGFFMIVFAVIALMGGLFQINPIWLFGPYKAAVVSAGSQPDWYVMFLDGSTRLFPAWEFRGLSHTVPAILWPTVVLPGLLTVFPMIYPFIEARIRKDYRAHHLLERPRDAPARTALGAMSIAFYLVLLISGGNDVMADKFHISLNAMTWAGRIAVLTAPPIAYFIAYRICLGLQQHDREVLTHGVETGIIRRLPSGKFVEVHQPLPTAADALPAAEAATGAIDAPVSTALAHRGQPTGAPTSADAEHPAHEEPEYTGWVVPKKTNRLGGFIPGIRGFFFPIEEPADDQAEQAEQATTSAAATAESPDVPIEGETIDPATTAGHTP
jgi:quinol---cytochrome-c reductase cytochrome b subunit